MQPAKKSLLSFSVHFLLQEKRIIRQKMKTQILIATILQYFKVAENLQT